MITLNLIPDPEKKELKIFSLYLMTKNILGILVLGIAIIAIALLSTKFILQNRFNKILDKDYLTASPAKFSSNEIKKINEELKVIQEVQKNYQPWSYFFINLAKFVNPGITVTAFDLNKEKGEIKISGTAEKREDLLKFEENVNQSGYFQKFATPLEMLFKKDNINFNFVLQLINLNVLKINPEELTATATPSQSPNQ